MPISPHNTIKKPVKTCLFSHIALIYEIKFPLLLLSYNLTSDNYEHKHRTHQLLLGITEVFER